MSFVNELSIEDNAAPPSATAKITAQRIGNLLRNRYQDFIHKREAGNGTWSNSDFLSFKNACDKLQSEEYERFDEILREKQSDISMALSSFDYKFLFVMMHTGKKGAAENILSDMKQWQRELNLASLIADNTPNDDLPFQVHLVSAEDIQQWLAAGTRSSVDLDDVEIEKYGQIDEPHQAFYGLVSGDQIA
ncbi:hypothetical protein I4K85_003466, partial [Salmonella enterica subsp. enterica serovar Derby]|nr:hypothetical protein [Salmonella enterica subsp. enterica]EBO2066080.1 hypothetical protein [Salmonella enterica subsp. enterica serovar Derby]ECH2645870.1 hypothetical protein [Salmonella enterica subsp. enterica serovar Derby]EDG1358528.1 hypothetical protein [Salmonella enterica subsp. enterica serovar Derby]EDG4942548.1 hypothetical protein [Salmonella enterica subsp. enterica serovar Derby]